jgi:GTP-binding protein EngB required for normal cell division
VPNVEDQPAPLFSKAATESLVRISAIADALNEGTLSAEVRELTTRLGEGRFFVACIGQFKRGKSTLLNALVGESILPTGVTPVTAVPTVLRYGAQRSARVLIAAQWQNILPTALEQYVSEEGNPENRKQVEGVEVFVPSPLLANGMCLVDTPGIGSVLAGNTETTKQFIPQIDAALLVVGADPPISGDELALIEAVAANVDEIVVVLNKIDRVSLSEREQASAFAARVLESRLQRPISRIYEVSALNELNNATDEADWNMLVDDLARLAEESGAAMMQSAAERGVRRYAAALRRSVKERLRALEEPIASSEQRIAGLRQTVSQAEQSLRDLGVLFSADQMRLSTTLQLRRKEFLRSTLPAAEEELANRTRPVKTSFGPALRHELMAQAQSVARHHVMPWLDAEEAQAEELYLQMTQRFVALVNGLLQQLAEQRSAEFSHLPPTLDADAGFRSRSRFYFHDMITVAQPASPLRYSADVTMGLLHVRVAFERDAQQFLEQLLDTNASRVQGDVEQRVVQSRLYLEAEVRRLLRAVSATAEQALARAREVMAAGAAAVESEVSRLRQLDEELQTIAASANQTSS